MSRADKITKQQLDVWGQELSGTSILGSLASTSEMTVVATVGRYGETNAINLEIQRKEQSAVNASLTSTLLGARGSHFFFGLKDAGPVDLEVTDVSNDAKVSQGLLDAKATNTVILSAVLSDGQLAVFREALTTHPIDAVRIGLAGGQTIEKNVSDGNGKKMMTKFSCFFQALDKRGIDLKAADVAAPVAGSAPDATDYAATAPGKYTYKSGGRSNKPGDYIELDPDGKFYLLEGGKGYAGSYSVKGATLTLILASGQAGRCKFSSNRIVCDDGSVSERIGEAPAAAPTLTIQKVIDMVTAKVSDDAILGAIKKSGQKFDLSPDMLIKLKSAGASDAVIRAMSN